MVMEFDSVPCLATKAPFRFDEQYAMFTYICAI